MRKIKCSEVTLNYVCPHCDMEAQQPLDDLTEIGCLICSDCECDMDLDGSVVIADQRPGGYDDTLFIVVDGGTVTTVFLPPNDDQLNFVIVDWDNLKRGDMISECDAREYVKRSEHCDWKDIEPYVEYMANPT